ncbi:MAG TPA: O-antigen ligase family protein [Gemmatimonadaceae bacterium]|nr:O-antigen ligase family protein [Gemmatimonadaceae bacterium]
MSSTAVRLPYRPRRTRAVVVADDRTVAHWGMAFALIIIVAWTTSVLVGFALPFKLLVLVGFAGMMIGIRLPAVGLMGITILCVSDAPARVYIMTGGLFRWNSFNYALLFVALIAAPTLLRVRDPHTRLLQLLLLTLGWGLLVTPDLAEGEQQMIAAVSAMGLLYYTLRAAPSREAWYWAGFNGVLMAAAMGLSYYVHRNQLPGINANAWALSLVGGLVAACFASVAAGRRRLRQLGILAVASVVLVSIFLSGSRGSLLIGLFCVFVMMLILPSVPMRAFAIAIGAVIAAVSIARFGDLEANSLHRIRKMLTREHDLSGDYSLSARTNGRSELVMGGIYMFRHQPMGVGTGGFDIAWRDLPLEAGVSFKRGREFSAHSGWIKVLAENGVVGITLLMAWVVSFYLVARRRRERILRLLGVLTTGVLGLALLSTEFQSKPLWFLVCGFTALVYSAPWLRAPGSVLPGRGADPRREAPPLPPLDGRSGYR